MTVSAFLAHLAETGKAANTVLAYRNDVTQLERFLVRLKRSPEVRWSDVTAAEVRAWDASSHGQPATRARKRQAAVSFFRYLGREVDFPPLSVPKPAPVLLTVAELDALVSAPGRARASGGRGAGVRGGTPLDLRDEAMLRVLRATGMRAGELVGLFLDDLAVGYVRVGQGKRWREIPLDGATLAALGTYLASGRPKLVREHTHGALFPDKHGGRLTRQGLWLIVKGYVREVCGVQDVTPSTIRHSFAFHLLAGHADLGDVRYLMGHANIATTEVYQRLARARAA